ncbi:unnamed protein product [Cladocopium goreaui]|uniref:Uncharacterized protein n=1 Tax=Cladocopium goreaui TaxID=2562237 RepID=A0A9P1DSY8_9DINO|nr:unnamed protein product [Cladocopium goreaui]
MALLQIGRVGGSDYLVPPWMLQTVAPSEAKHHPYHERMQRRWMTAASRNSGITDDAGTQQAIESILAGWSPSPATAAVPKHSDCPKPDAFE